MKKFLGLLVICCFVTSVFGQTKPRNKYLNIGYVSEKLTPDGGDAWESKFGASLSRGRTFFLHKNGLAKILYFGIDLTYIDLNYAQYKYDGLYTYEDENGVPQTEQQDFVNHQAQVGMQVGPSVHLGLTDGFALSGYARYSPTYSLSYVEDEVHGGYGGFVVYGATASFGVFGIGVEKRTGSPKHNFGFHIEEMEEKESVNNKFDLDGTRVFLSFKF